MNSRDLKLNSEKQIEPSSILLFGLGVVALGLLVTRLKFMMAALSTDPPPIFIKSGSFTIESDQPLTPPSAHQQSYKRNGFGRILGIRVIWYNELVKEDPIIDDFQEGADWSSSEGVQIIINLQYCQHENPNGVCLSWGMDRQMVIHNNGSDFELITPIKLSANKGKKHPKRKSKREDEEMQAIRISSVELVKKSNGRRIKFYPERDGREYLIGIYNSLARR